MLAAHLEWSGKFEVMELTNGRSGVE